MATSKKPELPTPPAHTPTLQKAATLTIMVPIFALIVGWLVYSIFAPDDKTKPEFKKWYSGGNLHNATAAEWRAASYTNRLATAGDWYVAGVLKGNLGSLTESDVRKRAVRLEGCVSRSVKSGSASKLGVLASEVAVVCIVGLGR